LTVRESIFKKLILFDNFYQELRRILCEFDKMFSHFYYITKGQKDKRDETFLFPVDSLIRKNGWLNENKKDIKSPPERNCRIIKLRCHRYKVFLKGADQNSWP